VQKNIENSISDVGKERIQGSTPEGNIFKGEFSLGKDPTISGYALQIAGVLGSMAPTLAVAMLTKDPSKAVTRGTTVGGGMAAGEGAHEARDKLGKLSTKELYEVSPYYKGLVDNGVAPERAKELTISKASESAAMLQGIPYRKTALYGFLIATFLAAIAGALLAPVTVISANVGSDFLIKGFIAIVIGGLGSIPGSIIGSILIAVIESVGGYYFDPSLATLAMFVITMLVLLVRPKGIMGNG
jgi:hypothetical protein